MKETSQVRARPHRKYILTFLLIFPQNTPKKYRKVCIFCVGLLMREQTDGQTYRGSRRAFRAGRSAQQPHTVCWVPPDTARTSKTLASSLCAWRRISVDAPFYGRKSPPVSSSSDCPVQTENLTVRKEAVKQSGKETKYNKIKWKLKCPI